MNNTHTHANAHALSSPGVPMDTHDANGRSLTPQTEVGVHTAYYHVTTAKGLACIQESMVIKANGRSFLHAERLAFLYCNEFPSEWAIDVVGPSKGSKIVIEIEIGDCELMVDPNDEGIYGEAVCCYNDIPITRIVNQTTVPSLGY